MKYITVLLFLAFFVLPVGAQQMISVIDHDTRKPIWRAYFIQDGDTIAYTSPEGIALVPKRPGKVSIIARDYKTQTFNADSIPPTIHLISELQQLDEIVVIGDKNKYIPKEFTPKYGSDRMDGKYAGGGGDLGKIFRIFGYKPASEIRRNRVKKNLEAFDKAPSIPAPQTK